jgi:hypothetical protein
LELENGYESEMFCVSGCRKNYFQKKKRSSLMGFSRFAEANGFFCTLFCEDCLIDFVADFCFWLLHCCFCVEIYFFQACPLLALQQVLIP